MQSGSLYLTLSSLCVVVNLVLGTIVSSMKIPLLFLDTIGTIFGAALMGPLYGVMIGASTNIIQGALTNPRTIPFALVNMAIGLVVGLVARKKGFSLPVALVTGLVLAVLAPLIGTPIAIWLYGGLTGGGMDLVFVWLRTTGQSIFTAAFLPRIAGNLLDKVVSCLLVSVLFLKLPPRILALNPRLKARE
ncbi:MAG: ECF transporter S component [Synergistales bacterium]|nr:ECF transporter S component [Synergistales bacterium]